MNRLAIGCLGFCCFLLTGCGSSPEQLARDFIAAIEANDAAKIRSLYEQSKKLTPEEDARFNDESEKMIGNDPVKITRYLRTIFAALGNDAPPEMKAMIQALDRGPGGIEDSLKNMGKEMMQGMDKMGQEFMKGMKDLGKGGVPAPQGGVFGGNK